MRRNNRRGVALITAMWMLAVLLILLAGFTAMVHSETQIARNFGQLTRARWAARAGLARAEAAVISLVGEPATSLGEEAQVVLTSQDAGAGLDDTGYQAIIEDEAARVNVNTASLETLQMFFPLEVADAIVDWRDADSTPQPDGAEEEYYAGLTPAYHCRNAPLLTVGELRLVKGVTRELLATPLTEGGRPLEALLTVASRDANTDANGQPRVNIATATKEAMTQGFGTVVTAQDVDAIIKQRSSQAFDSVADLLDVPGFSREKVAQLYDLATVTTDTVRKGLVNINTVPVDVLAALPGMDEATAQAIVDHRTNESPFDSVGQLLNVDGVDTAVFKRAAVLFTTRSRVFRVTAEGRDPDGVQVTLTCVLQTETAGETTTTRVLYWHE